MSSANPSDHWGRLLRPAAVGNPLHVLVDQGLDRPRPLPRQYVTRDLPRK